MCSAVLNPAEAWPAVRFRKVQPRAVATWLGPELREMPWFAERLREDWALHTCRAEGDADTHQDLLSILGFAGRLALFAQGAIEALRPKRVLALLGPDAEGWWELSTRGRPYWFPELSGRIARIRCRRLGITPGFRGGLSLKPEAASQLIPTFCLMAGVRRSCDLYLVLPACPAVVMFCHHCDIHVYMPKARSLGELEDLARVHGLSVVPGVDPIRQPGPVR